MMVMWRFNTAGLKNLIRYRWCHCSKVKPQLFNLGLQRCSCSYVNHLYNLRSFFSPCSRHNSHDLWLSLEKAYAPHSTSREYTLKTQLLRIEMHGDETPDTYLNRAQEYADALAAISEPIKVFVKNITVLKLQSLPIKVQLHLASFMHSLVIMIIFLEKLVHCSLYTHFCVHKLRSGLTKHARSSSRSTFRSAQMSALGFQVSPIATPLLPQAFMVPSSPRSPISSPSSVSHLSPTSQTSPESSNGQLSPLSTTSIPTPPPTPPPPPPPITRQRPANLRQNPRQRVPYNPSANHATVLPTTITEPTSFIVANNSPKWCQAMKEEYDALMKNGTWSLVPRTSNRNVVDGKWVYRLKWDKNGAITRYKARFVAKGFRQQPDIQNAFLHGNLKEQAPRAWFERLSKALFNLGFKGSKTDPSLFIYSRGDTLLYILVYVDDIIVTGNNKGTIDNIICQLGSAFALKDLGPLNYFLGIEIVPHVSGILLSQKKYILELLQSAGLSNYNPVSSPMVTSSSLSFDDSTAFSNPVKYRQIVGSLQYVTLSRPNIAFAVNKVCQYMHAPTENHWSAVKWILRYLHGTVEHGMLIRRSSGSTLQAFTDVLWKGNPDTSLEAFSDADRAGDSDDRRSTGGFAIYLGSNLISWTARKQCTVSRSSTEAEYKALADTVAELTWLQALLNELGIHSSSTPILWCDNLGATYMSANSIFHARTKHVEIDYHFFREKVAQGDL
ncbi:putative RNA-directed DNA polymerase [Tanacetum coccineum]